MTIEELVRELKRQPEGRLEVSTRQGERIVVDRPSRVKIIRNGTVYVFPELMGEHPYATAEPPVVTRVEDVLELRPLHGAKA